MHATILRDLSVIWCLFHILVVFMLLYRSRFSRRKTLLLTGICMIPLIAGNVWGLISLGSARMGQLFLLTCTLPSLLFYYYMSKDRRGRFLFTFCLSDTVAYWIIIVTNLLDFYLGGGGYLLMFLSRLVLFPLLEWGIFRRLRKPYRELQESVDRGWNVFAAMSALYYILLAVTANFPVIITDRPGELLGFLLILLLMPMNYATIFIAMYRQLLLYRRQKNEHILQEVRQQMEIQLDNQRRIRKIRHDMKAHVITLSGLLAQGKTEEAQEYLNKAISVEKAYGEQFCANPYLNAVLGYYVMKFDELGILVHLDIRTGEERLQHMELCQILSNGLENAWDASGRLPSSVEKMVSVQMRYQRNWLIIRIKNRCRDDLRVEKGSIPETEKKEAGHGFGLQTIQEAAKRMKGEMFCYTEQGFFILDVMVRGDDRVWLMRN